LTERRFLFVCSQNRLRSPTAEQVFADWPGLARSALHENRDLRPTRDLRAVMKGVLRDHLGVPAPALDEQVFPGSVAVRPLEGLLRA
jgi:uncharacterized protein (DUF1501 family)